MSRVPSGVPTGGGTPSPSPTYKPPSAPKVAPPTFSTSGVVPTASSTYGNVYGIGVIPAGSWYGSGGYGGSTLEHHGAFDNGLGYNQALSYIWGPAASASDQKQFAGFVDGFYGKGAKFSTQKALWNGAVQTASRYNASNPGARVTVWQVLQQAWQQYLASGGKPGGASGSRGGGGGGGGRGSSSTSTSYSFTGKSEAGAVLDNAWQQLLGESATEADKAAFLTKLHAEQKAQPTTVSQHVSANGSSSSVSQHTTTVSPQANAITMAQEQPEYAAFQDATTYFDAMMSALGAPK